MYVVSLKYKTIKVSGKIKLNLQRQITHLSVVVMAPCSFLTTTLPPRTKIGAGDVSGADAATNLTPMSPSNTVWLW